MTLDDRGRQAADDARAAAATTDLAALRARVGAAGDGDPGHGRRAGAALAVAAALLLVGLGIGLLVSGLRTTGRNAASSADRVSAPVARAAGGSVDAHTAGGSVDAYTTGGTTDAQPGAALSAQSSARSFDRRVVGVPTTGLVAGESVTLQGFGFAPGSPFVVRQCVQAAVAPSTGGTASCDELSGSPVRDANVGAYVVVRAERFIRAAGDADCAERPGRCILVVTTRDQPDHAGAVALTFAPVSTTTAP